jgi:tRNA(Arg) A34 adenosine deaminase TadA
MRNRTASYVFALLCSVQAINSIAANPQNVINERHELFMTAAAAFVYVNLSTLPRPGHNIAALIAWNIDVVEKTPDFVIDRNRNFEYQGEIHHAEINTMRRAYEKRKNYDLAPSASQMGRTDSYSRLLANSTLNTTLEPCPMCATTMLLASIPRAIYFMEDPGLRDPKPPHNLTIQVPDAVFGRRLVQMRSSMKEAEDANNKMWDTAMPLMPKFRITDYLAPNGKDVFELSFKKLQCFKVINSENSELLVRLRGAVGVPLSRLASVQGGQESKVSLSSLNRTKAEALRASKKAPSAYDRCKCHKRDQAQVTVPAFMLKRYIISNASWA